MWLASGKRSFDRLYRERRMTRTGILLCALAIASAVNAHTVVIDGGKVHLRGELVNGGCAVAPDSQNMRVDMGQDRTNAFSGVGSFSTVNVPFTVRLLDCSVDVSAPWGSVPGSDTGRRSAGFPGDIAAGENAVSSGVGLALLTNSNVRSSRTRRR